MLPQSFPKSLQDDAGNEATCTLTVEVSDNERPVILCPENVSMTTELQPSGGKVKVHLVDLTSRYV